MPYDYKLLRAARERKGWTGTMAARKLGVTRAAISMIERGRRQGPVLVRAYARALGIPMSDVVISDRELEALRQETEVRV